MLPLWKTRATAFVFAWTLIHTALINAQGFYYKDLGLSCSSAQTFQYLGCAATPPTWAYEPEEPPVPGSAIGSKSYINWALGSLVNATATPHYCADACRAHGFKYAAVREGYQCRCGGSLTPGGSARINTDLAESNCNYRCSGDGGETCGGSGYSRIYVDPSFPDEDGLDNPIAQVDNYKRLGCFQRVTFSVNLAAVEAAPVVTPQECLSKCAGFGYPYAVMGKFSTES